ncbi:hypothetical protein [Azospirillum sp.]|uniref:hypothetical protein n=1 Tax=Azospirillum sp. TaxID=34012 RepID=UPI003D722784
MADPGSDKPPFVDCAEPGGNRFVTYAIRCPHTGAAFYVGQTEDFAKRQRTHLKGLRVRPRGTGVRRWLHAVVSSGGTPVFEVLEEVGTLAESIESESRWIGLLATRGEPLLNKHRWHRDIMAEAIGGVRATMDTATGNGAEREAAITDHWTVYGIVDPADHRVFYVGTVNGTRAYRAGEHPKVDERIRQIRGGGAMPVFVVFEVTGGSDAAERAQVFWVEVLTGRGNKLLNGGGYRPPPKVAKPKLSPEERRAAARQRAIEHGLPENTGQAWTDEQDVELTRLYRDEGKGGTELADHFGRTRGAIGSRLVRLGLLEDRRDLRA